MSLVLPPESDYSNSDLTGILLIVDRGIMVFVRTVPHGYLGGIFSIITTSNLIGGANLKVVAYSVTILLTAYAIIFIVFISPTSQWDTWDTYGLICQTLGYGLGLFSIGLINK